MSATSAPANVEADQPVEQRIKLQSNDGKVFDVSLKVANMSATIKTMLEQLGDTDTDSENQEPITIHNVNGEIMTLVIKWAEHHKNDPEPEVDEDDDEADKRYLTEIPQWDADFLSVEQPILFEVIVAANYLDIKGLLDVSCQTVANMIKGKTPEQIRAHFNIENDFTPEEEERIRKENEWCEEK